MISNRCDLSTNVEAVPPALFFAVRLRNGVSPETMALMDAVQFIFRYNKFFAPRAPPIAIICNQIGLKEIKEDDRQHVERGTSSM